MLRDRYPAVDLFALMPGLTLRFEPVLEQLARLLEDGAAMGHLRIDPPARQASVAEERTSSLTNASQRRLLSTKYCSAKA
jgi:hypothetical protein